MEATSNISSNNNDKLLRLARRLWNVEPRDRGLSGFAWPSTKLVVIESTTTKNGRIEAFAHGWPTTNIGPFKLFAQIQKQKARILVFCFCVLREMENVVHISGNIVCQLWWHREREREGGETEANGKRKMENT